MKKCSDELSMQEAADLMSVDVSTINRWRRLGSLPAKFRLNKHYVKRSSIEKIKAAMEQYGVEWRRKMNEIQDENSDDFKKRFFGKTVAINPEDLARPDLAFPVVTKKHIALAKIAKDLESLEERDLASAVALRAVALM